MDIWLIYAAVSSICVCVCVFQASTCSDSTLIHPRGEVCTNLHQSGEMLQHAHRGELQEVIVSQIEAGQIDSREDAEGEAPQQVCVEKQQLQGRHGVEGAWVDLMDLIVFKVEVPEGRQDGVNTSLSVALKEKHQHWSDLNITTSRRRSSVYLFLSYLCMNNTDHGTTWIMYIIVFCL